MGKGFKQEPSLHSFTRMNFLYQASMLCNKLPLANYYGKLVKDISKKTVEKVHPNVKRTLCKACSYPLLTPEASSISLDVKVKCSKKKKFRNKKKKEKKVNKICKFYDKEIVQKYSKKTRLDARREKKPNKLLWICNHCGFSSCMLQKPDHKLWINEVASNSL